MNLRRCLKPSLCRLILLCGVCMMCLGRLFRMTFSTNLPTRERDKRPAPLQRPGSGPRALPDSMADQVLSLAATSPTSAGKRYPMQGTAALSDDHDNGAWAGAKMPQEEVTPSRFVSKASLSRASKQPSKSRWPPDPMQQRRCDPAGLVGDGMTDNTAFFQKAIAACRNQFVSGGHFVMELPPGVFLTGTIHLIDRMTLRIGRDSVVNGIQDSEAYPLLPPLPSYGLGRDWARDLTQRHAPLIFGFNLTDVIIEGSGIENEKRDGVIDGKGSWWWTKFNEKSLQYGRPSLIQIMYSRNIIIRRIRLRNPPFWNTHFYASTDVLVDNVHIVSPYLSPNTDGINLDSVHRAVVRHCDISTGDDAIAIKSGLNQAGLDFHVSSAHIHVHDTRIRSKCLSIGSEMSGGIHDVRVENIRFGDSRSENRWHGIFIKTSRQRGGFVKNIIFQNISSASRTGPTEKMKTFIDISMTYGSHNGPESTPAGRPPVFKNFTFRNISVRGAKQVANLSGLPDSPISHVSIEGLTALNHDNGIHCVNTASISILRSNVKGRKCRPPLSEYVMSQLEPLDPLPDNPAERSYKDWLDRRTALIRNIFGPLDGNLPSRDFPEKVRTQVAPGIDALVWNITEQFSMTSTVFYAPLHGDVSPRSAVLWHHGHHDCICPTTRKQTFAMAGSVLGRKFKKFGPRPGWIQARCAPGCRGWWHDEAAAKPGSGSTWWDLDNITRFFHSLGHHVFILSMPLVGINYVKGRANNKSDHTWLERLEQSGHDTMRFFCEPVILTVNYAINRLGMKDIYLAGLSGGAWTTSIVASMDPRIRTSFQIAGTIPYPMRFTLAAESSEPLPTGDIGDFEQRCRPAHHKYSINTDPAPTYCQACNYKCQYVLGSLDRGRAQVQILHENDGCCYAAAGRHAEILGYESRVRFALNGGANGGWFTVVVTDHRTHELCEKDRKVIAAVMKGRFTPGHATWNVLPCDVLHGESNLAASCNESSAIAS